MLTVPCAMSFVLHRSALPLLSRHCNKAAHLRADSLANSRLYWCTACSTSDTLTSKARGQVISKEANFVKVRLDSSTASKPAGSSHEVLFCTVRALLKKIKQTVLVGDHVEVQAIDWTDMQGVVYDVIDRQSETRDPAIANVDQMLLVMSLNLPPFDAQQATRFLVSSEAAEIPVTLLLNKADLMKEDDTAAVIEEVGQWGYKAIAVSVATGQGIRELANALQGKLSAVIGPSGVGKSSIINALRLRQQEQADQSWHAQTESKSTMPSKHAASDGEEAACLSDESSMTSVSQCTAEARHNSTAAGQWAVPSNEDAGLSEASSAQHAHNGASPGQNGNSSSAQASALLDQQPHQSHYRQQQASNGAVQSPTGETSARNTLSTNEASRLNGSGHAERLLDLHDTAAPGNDSGRQPSEVDATDSVHSSDMMQLQSVGEMSNIGRGMHTTRHVALLEIGGGLLADTPGFNVPSTANLTVANLQKCFPEIQARLETDSFGLVCMQLLPQLCQSLQRCAFSNCQHVQEPGCCLQEGFDRHSLYVELYHEVKQQEDLERHRSMSKKRRQGNVRFKTKAGGQQEREALLETKTHRRVNRRQTRQGMQNLLEEHGVAEDD